MGERRLHSVPVSVTVGKVTAETRYSGALVWVGGEGKSGSTGWSHSFPIASLEHNRDMHKRMARMRAFNAIQSASDAINFKKFLTMDAFINEAPLPEGFGRPILVSGKPAFWIEHAGGNTVRFAWPDDATVLISHELDVQEVA